MIKRIKSLFVLLLFYAKDIFVSALRIAYDVVTPTQHSQPGIFEYPLSAKSDLEVFVLSNLITFSPGTMVVGYIPSRNILLIHSMFLDDVDKACATVKEKLELKLLEVMR